MKQEMLFARFINSEKYAGKLDTEFGVGDEAHINHQLIDIIINLTILDKRKVFDITNLFFV